MDLIPRVKSNLGCLLGRREVRENRNRITPFRNITELTLPVRTAFESCSWPTFGDDERVSINAYSAARAQWRCPPKAYRRLLEFGDKMAERTKDLPEAEIDPAIDEAVDYVRHHSE